MNGTVGVGGIHVAVGTKQPGRSHGPCVSAGSGVKGVGSGVGGGGAHQSSQPGRGVSVGYGVSGVGYGDAGGGMVWADTATNARGTADTASNSMAAMITSNPGRMATPLGVTANCELRHNHCTPVLKGVSCHVCDGMLTNAGGVQ
jgi:hypothetical protein